MTYPDLVPCPLFKVVSKNGAKGFYACRIQGPIVVAYPAGHLSKMTSLILESDGNGSTQEEAEAIMKYHDRQWMACNVSGTHPDPKAWVVYRMGQNESFIAFLSIVKMLFWIHARSPS